MREAPASFNSFSFLSFFVFFLMNKRYFVEAHPGAQEWCAPPGQALSRRWIPDHWLELCTLKQNRYWFPKAPKSALEWKVSNLILPRSDTAPTSLSRSQAGRLSGLLKWAGREGVSFSFTFSSLKNPPAQLKKNSIDLIRKWTGTPKIAKGK